MAFVEAWDEPVPLVVVPTTYYTVTVPDLLRTGKVRMVIYANQGIRAIMNAMKWMLETVMRDGSTQRLERHLATLDEVFAVQRQFGQADTGQPSRQPRTRGGGQAISRSQTSYAQAQFMTIRVSVIGYDLLGKRIADAVAQQPDMDLVGVFDDDPSCQSMIVHRGYSLLPGPPDQLAPPGDVAVLCRTDCCVPDTPVIHAAHVRSSTGQLFTPLSRTGRYSRTVLRACRPAGRHCMGRILQAIDSLASVERLFASIIVPALATPPSDPQAASTPWSRSPKTPT